MGGAKHLGKPKQLVDVPLKRSSYQWHEDRRSHRRLSCFDMFGVPCRHAAQETSRNYLAVESGSKIQQKKASEKLRPCHNKHDLNDI